MYHFGFDSRLGWSPLPTLSLLLKLLLSLLLVTINFVVPHLKDLELAYKPDLQWPLSARNCSAGQCFLLIWKQSTRLGPSNLMVPAIPGPIHQTSPIPKEYAHRK